MRSLQDSLEHARREFPTLKKWRHFDSARKAPLPERAEQTMREFMKDIYETGGVEAFSPETVEDCRQSLARFAGTSSSRLAFIKNTTEGLNVVAHGLDLAAGDNIVLSELEHPANVLPWRQLQAKGVELRMVSARDGMLPVSAFERVINDRTRVVATSWVTYAQGARVDIPGLSNACREHGALVVVDGIQGMGLLDEDLDDLGADVFVSGGHKGLLGLTGTGFMFVRDEALEQISPVYAGHSTYREEDPWNPELQLSEGARRFEYGNPNFLGLRVLDASLSLLSGIGRGTIESRIQALTTRLIERAREAQLPLATPLDWPNRAGIVSFSFPDPESIRQRLREQSFLVSTKDGRWLRTACHFFNLEEEIDALVEALADAAARPPTGRVS